MTSRSRARETERHHFQSSSDFAAQNRWNNGRVFKVMSRFAQKTGTGIADTEELPVVASPFAAPLPAPMEEPPSVEEPPSASPSVEEPPSASPSPRAAESVAERISASRMLKKWREAGLLRPDDERLSASDFNVRLREAGVLDGGPRAWEPTTLARLLGAEVEQRNQQGEPYAAIVYTPQIQELLRGLYRDGKL